MRVTTVTLFKASQGEYRFSEEILTLIADDLEGMAVINVRTDQTGTVKEAWVAPDRIGNPCVRANVEFKV